MSKFFRSLKAPIEAGDWQKLLVNLQALDKPIQDALCVAARKGLVIAVPLLWDRLSPSGKQKFLDAENNGTGHGYLPPLHEAVKHGHLEMVCVLLGAFGFNINQKDHQGKTPLFYASINLEMTRYLLENGADVNQKDRHGKTPLFYAIRDGNPKILYIMLEQVSYAIRDGNPEILSIMLEHGAVVGCGETATADQTLLNELLKNSNKGRETKVAISQILVDHAKKDQGTLLFLQSSLEFAIDEAFCILYDGDDDDEYNYTNINILLEAGVVPRSQAFYIAIRGENVSLCQLLARHGGNPFLAVQDDTQYEDDEDAAAAM